MAAGDRAPKKVVDELLELIEMVGPRSGRSAGMGQPYKSGMR